MENKICTVCKRELEATSENFYIKGGKLGLNGELRPTCKSCTLKKNKEYIGKWVRRQTNKMYWGARMRAKKFNLEFTIEEADIIIPEKCPLTGVELFPGKLTTSKHSPSLDRIDNTKGYIKGNIQVISYNANKLKNNFTPEELKLFVTNISKCINDIV